MTITVPTSNDVTHRADAATSTLRWRPTAELPALDLLGVNVHYPTVGICVLAVDGEIDLATTPQLAKAVREHLAAAPTHLIVDLQQVQFLGCSALSCLLDARDLAHLAGSQLHLSGLCNRAVARPLELTALREQFDTHPTLAHALSTLTA